MKDYCKDQYLRKDYPLHQFKDYCTQDFIPHRRKTADKTQNSDKAAKIMVGLSASYLMFHLGMAYFR